MCKITSIDSGRHTSYICKESAVVWAPFFLHFFYCCYSISRLLCIFLPKCPINLIQFRCNQSEMDVKIEENRFSMETSTFSNYQLELCVCVFYSTNSLDRFIRLGVSRLRYTNLILFIQVDLSSFNCSIWQLYIVTIDKRMKLNPNELFDWVLLKFCCFELHTHGRFFLVSLFWYEISIENVQLTAAWTWTPIGTLLIIIIYSLRLFNVFYTRNFFFCFILNIMLTQSIIAYMLEQIVQHNDKYAWAKSKTKREKILN